LKFARRFRSAVSLGLLVVAVSRVAGAQAEASVDAGPSATAPPPPALPSAAAPAPLAPAAPPSASAPPVTSAPPLLPVTPAAPSSATLDVELQALRDEVRALRVQVAQDESARAAASNPPAAPPPAPPVVRAAPPPREASPARHPLGWEAFWPWYTPPDGIALGGYVQGQYQWNQVSTDQLNQSGAPLNQDRFTLRRARVNVTGDWTYAAFAVELDANTNSGPQVDLRKAEASLQYRPDRSKPPLLMATLGLFDTPFGYELVESPRTRWFLERSQLSQAFWPGEPDLGMRLAGALGFFRWTIALVNGQPLGESSFALQDPIGAKDVVFRFGFDTLPRDDLHFAGGVSATRGQGFHAGTPATSSTLTWVDINGDGKIESNELVPIIGRAATPSQTFDRWAVGADLRVHLRTPIGVTKLYGEFVVAEDMDRALYVADPVSTGVDVRELGFYVALTQEIGDYAVVGFRYDYYDPNSDAFSKRGGQLLPFNEAIKTASPLVGVSLPDRARLLFEYDIVENAMGLSTAGVPTNLKDNGWAVRLQVQL
jgi:hypothetical protein